MCEGEGGGEDVLEEEFDFSRREDVWILVSQAPIPLWIIFLLCMGTCLTAVSSWPPDIPMWLLLGVGWGSDIGALTHRVLDHTKFDLLGRILSRRLLEGVKALYGGYLKDNLVFEFALSMQLYPKCPWSEVDHAPSKEAH